jgi:integrase
MAGKRGNGEGTIKQRTITLKDGTRKSGGWEAQISLGSGVRKSFYGRTRQEVASKLAAARRDLDKGMFIVRDERQTVGQYLTTWLADVQTQIRPSSHRRYGDYVRLHLVPALGKIPLTKLTAQQVQALYTRKRADGLSATTVHSLHGVLHRALKDAERLGLVQRNVSEQVRPPRRSTAEMQTLTEEQAARFLAAAEGDRFHALYVLALTTGMREGELLGLRWGDVDLDRGRLQVRVAVQETATVYILAEPKTGHSRRTIGLSSLAVQALRDHRGRQLEERLALGPAWTEQDLVFPSAVGGLMIPHNLAKRGFKRVLKHAGLPDLHFHCLRHTAATTLLSRGVSPKVVSEMLGHADISITLRVYAHVTPHMQQTAVDVMQHVFGS